MEKDGFFETWFEKKVFKFIVLFVYVIIRSLGSVNDKLTWIVRNSKVINEYLVINIKTGKINMRVSSVINKFNESKKRKNSGYLYKGFVDGLNTIPNNLEGKLLKKKTDKVFFKTHQNIYEKFLEIKEIDSNLCSIKIIKNKDDSKKETYVLEYLFMYTFFDLIRKNPDELKEILIKSEKAEVEIEVENIKKVAYLLRNRRVFIVK